MKLYLEIELEYDSELMHGSDPEAVSWFYNDVLDGTGELLILHSNLLGDEVGLVKVLDIKNRTKETL
jgi:hypothetical protein